MENQFYKRCCDDFFYHMHNYRKYVVNSLSYNHDVAYSDDKNAVADNVVDKSRDANRDDNLVHDDRNDDKMDDDSLEYLVQN